LGQTQSHHHSVTTSLKDFDLVGFIKSAKSGMRRAAIEWLDELYIALPPGLTPIYFYRGTKARQAYRCRPPSGKTG
jgi:hypothetical protein